MPAELVECWLCEATIAPDEALLRYRDEQGRVHPWADRRGRWQPEYICSACALAVIGIRASIISSYRQMV